MKKIIDLSFQPALWLSSAEEQEMNPFRGKKFFFSIPIFAIFWHFCSPCKIVQLLLSHYTH